MILHELVENDGYHLAIVFPERCRCSEDIRFGFVVDTAAAVGNATAGEVAQEREVPFNGVEEM